MEKPLSKRLLSLVCAMTLVCSMAAPAAAAAGTESPLVSEGHSHTAEEAPAAQTPELLDAAASGTYVIKPDADPLKAPTLFAAPRAGQTVHAMDFGSGTANSFFTVSGNTASTKGTVIYGGKTYDTCLKIESSTNISFTVPTGGGTLNLVFGGSGKTNIKIDGTTETAASVDGNFVLTAELAAGSHTLTKADSSFLFYMELVTGPACIHENTQAIPAVPATCVKAGATAGKKCTVCQEIVEGCEVIPIAPTAHQWNDSTGKCSLCGAVDPDKCPHASLTATPARAKTCTADGNKAYWTCGACKVLFSDAAHTTKTTLAAVTEKAEGHKFGADNRCTVCGAEKTSFTKQSGWLESAYIEWPIEAGVNKYTVFIQKDNGAWTQLDEPLVREYPGKMRADAVGLAAGNYKMKVVDNKGGEMVSDALTVLPHDRSGYAFANSSTTPGAYKADGTLKDNAVVVYVTNETKDTVTIPGVVDSNKNPCTGIGSIVQYAYKKKDNTTPPICLRLIGTITDPADMPGGDLYVDGGSHGKCAGLTIEGIGNDAVCNTFGIVLKGASYVEIRNLGMMNCDSDEKDEIGLQQANDHVWVHNNDIFYGNAGSDGDQAKGDGALDTKKSTYVTHSYNHFWDCGKCNLQGMKDETTENYITYHHNWFDHSDSRHPRIRTCTVHIYNNYYDGNAKYGVGVTMGASAFVENNYFRNCKHPMLSSKQGTDALGDGTFSGENGGVIKAYGNTIIGGEPVISWAENNTSFDAYMASSRNETVPSSVKTLSGGTTYSNFDTASNFYQYDVQSPEDAAVTVAKYAGRVEGGDFQFDFDDETEDSNYAVIPELKSALMSYKTSLVSVGGGVKNPSAAPIDPDTCKHSWGTWKVTVAATATTKGSEERTCLLCGKVEKREVPAGGSSGGDGSGSSGSSNVLRYSDFTVSDPAKDKTSISDKIADVANGYFTLYGKADKILRRSSSTTKFAIDFIDLPIDSTNHTTVPAGIQFTVKDAPATVKVTASSTSNTSKTSKFALYKLEGSALAEVSGTATQVDKNVGNAQSHSFNDIPAGTYVLAAVPNSTNNVRLRELSVAEASTEPDPGECTHANKQNVPAVPATCQKEGVSAGVKCADCGKLLSGCETIAKLKHNYKLIIPGVEPTCVKDGVTDTYECTLCGDRYGNRAVNKLGHDYGTWVRVDKDLHMHVCQRPGCSEDTAGHTETAEHDWQRVGEPVKSPCTGEVVTNYHCPDCGMDKQERTGGTGGSHAWGEPAVIVPATCITPGTSRVTCTRDGCGAFENQTVEALGHDLTKVEAKAATCTVDGNKEHYACKRSGCGKLFLDAAGKTSVALKDVSIPAGHTYGDPSWTWEGYTKATAIFTCTVCNEGTEGHTLRLNAAITSVTIKEPTSSAEGEKTHTASVTLNKKDYTDVKTESLPATGGSSGGGGGGGSSSSKPKPTLKPTETEQPKPQPEVPALNTEERVPYISGFADGTVGGRRNITRQETAVIFYRLLTAQARKDYGADSNIFPDVAGDYWANREISTLIKAGIIKGLPDGTFGPTQNITRAEFITMASRFFTVTTEKDNPFPDVTGHWAEREILFAYSKGWIKGLPDGTFAPNQFITRGEAVHIINGILGRKADAQSIPAGAENKWSDLSPADWFYYDMLEATTGSALQEGGLTPKA